MLFRSLGAIYALVLLANPDLIDKLRVAVYPSIPFQAPTVGSPGCVFRFLPEPRGASARDPRSPPSTGRPATLRQATETDPGGSIAMGLAERRLERLAIQRLHRQGFDCHRLAWQRLSPVLGLEGPKRKAGAANRAKGGARVDSDHEPREPTLGRSADSRRVAQNWASTSAKPA